MRNMMDWKLLSCVVFGLVLTFAVVDMVLPGFKFAINEQIGSGAAAALRGVGGAIIGYVIYILLFGRPNVSP